MRAAIVGGGIAGLSLAIALEPTGTEVDVFERERQWTAHGAAIALRPLAVKALRRLGVLDGVMAEGRVLDRIRVLTTTGEVASERMLAFEGEPTVAIHRRALQQVLAGRLERTTVRLGVRPAAITEAGPMVELSLSSGERIRCDILVGADGVYSWVRQQLFPDAVTSPTGQRSWRFCVEGELTEAWTLVLASSRYAVAQPLPGMTYCAAVLGRSASSPDVAETAVGLRDAFSEFPPPISDVPARVTPATDIHFGAIHEVSLDRWSEGQVGLIGDAAHALSPIMALGGGLALEDGVVLAQELERAATPRAALEAFTARRQPRVDLVRSLAHERSVTFDGGQHDFNDRDFQRRAAFLLEDP